MPYRWSFIDFIHFVLTKKIIRHFMESKHKGSVTPSFQLNQMSFLLGFIAFDITIKKDIFEGCIYHITV